jgi:hydroxymethylbilane synthase
VSAREILIGTRGSALALAQARLVAAAFEREGRPIRLVVVKTEGDRRAPDTAWGEGAFVAAIERALLDGRVDVAVHSAKDVPTDEDPRLRVGAFLPRADPRDVLVVRADARERRLDDLPAGRRVGTDSPRRVGFVLARRPDLVVHPLHGNVDTRLRRLDDGETDALVLAAAGLERLGRADRIAERLDPDVVLPAPGQGAIAIQIRRDDARLVGLAAAIDDRPTRIAVEAERAFLAASGGGCRAPIGVLATIEKGELVIVGAYARADGSAVARDRVRGPAADGLQLGAALAALLGARLPDVGRQVDVPSGTATFTTATRRPRVLITRAADQAGELTDCLNAFEIDGVSVPAIAIAIAPVPPGGDLDRAAHDLASYQWVVVTSVNGARAILPAAERVLALPREEPRWAAIGGATRRALEDEGFDVALQPSRASATAIAAELPVGSGDRVLLLRGDLADHELPDALRARGAEVDDVVAYRTVEAPDSSRRLLRRAIEVGRIEAVLFTSGSTVRGLVALAAAESLIGVTAIPAICIGPETAREAGRFGFRVLAEAPERGAQALAATTAEALATQPQEIR